MKTFKIFSDCLRKKCGSFKRRIIFNIPKTFFKGTLVLLVIIMNLSVMKRVSVLNQKINPRFTIKFAAKKQVFHVCFLINHLCLNCLICPLYQEMKFTELDCICKHIKKIIKKQTRFEFYKFVYWICPNVFPCEYC